VNKPALDELRIDRPARSEDGSKWPWVAGLLVLLLVAAAGAWIMFRPPASLDVRTAVARESGGAKANTVLNASGYVTARLQATVSSKITGRVSEVLIEEGMAVEAGQVLARLDDANIRATYDLALAQTESARRALAETEALLEEARLNYERLQQLEQRELASTSELDRGRALARSLAAQLERKKADVVVAERSVEIYRRQLDDTVIRAPFAGIVVAKNAQPGEMVSPVSAGGGFTRTGIGTVVDMSSLEIEIDVNEAYINRVSPGQPVVATLDAYPDWNIPGHVIAIIPTADRQRATVEVRVGFDELDPRILPDMGVKVAFRETDPDESAEPSRPGVLVPGSALRKDGQRDIVFVMNGGRAERRAVAAGAEQGGNVVVFSGLAPGERVIVEAPADLADGDAVKESE
jgi:RND family efflux transporter MFP subunit